MASVMLRRSYAAARLLNSGCLPSQLPGKAFLSPAARLISSELPVFRGPSFVGGSGRLGLGGWKELLAVCRQCPSFTCVRGGEQDGRRHFGACSSESEFDGETVASQMITYAASCRKNGATHVEVARVLAQGHNFLLSRGPSAANAAGKVLLTLATFHIDGGSLLEAKDVLQQATTLEGGSIEISVSASEALIGLLLRMHEDSDALHHAHLLVKLVNDAKGLPLELNQDLKFRADAIVQFVEHATSYKPYGNLLNIDNLPLWLNDKEAHLNGIASALLGIAECAHVRGHLSQAKVYYEKASALAESSLGNGLFGFSAGAMTSQDVLVGASAGLGQVAFHLGDFDDAEVKLTKALTQAEQINGDEHQRVGAVLVCIADVYARRGLGKGSSDIVLPEGLYRKATKLLRTPSLDTPGQVVDMVDVMALSRARLASVLERVKNRESEAQNLRAWATAAWKGSRSLTAILAQEASMEPLAIKSDKEDVEDAYIGKYVVIDVRLGRVLS